MSQIPPSSLNNRPSAKRVAIQLPSDSHVEHPTGILKQPADTVKSPTEAATKMMDDYTATLHPNLQRLVNKKVKPVLNALMHTTKKKKSADKMLDDDAPVPQSVQKILKMFKLEALNEVKKKQEFQTISNKAADIVERCKRDLGKLVSEANKLTADHLQEEFVKRYCNFL